MKKAAVKEVWLNRAEGPYDECGAVVYYTGDEMPKSDDSHYKDAKGIHVEPNEIGGAVTGQLSKWGHTAPEDGGYDKTDFTVVWENGDDYTGRFDMQKGGTDTGEDFWTSLKHRIEHVACRRRPAHFTDEIWARHCKMYEEEGWKASAEHMLAQCELAA